MNEDHPDEVYFIYQGEILVKDYSEGSEIVTYA